MSQEVLISSPHYDGSTGQLLFKPVSTDTVINLGNVTFPYLFVPSELTPPREIYGSYTIYIQDTDCTYYLNIPKPTPTPTPTLTPTKTITPTVTSTPSPTPTYEQCKLPSQTPTPTYTSTPTQTPTVTITVTPSYNPCGIYPDPFKPNPTPTKTPKPTLTMNTNPCF